MVWKKLSKILLDFYTQKKIEHHFKKDEKYLSDAFEEIEKIWTKNYNEIKLINFVMLSEAPLWGKIKKYVYNPKINNSQFFYRSDLEYCLNEIINDKTEFIEKLNEIGFIILDISPFALNDKDTVISYRSIKKREYRNLLTETLPIHFAEKLELIGKKRSENIQVFYRYGRVKKSFNDLISKTILEKGLVRTEDEILDISQAGGGINKNKLNDIIMAKRNVSE